MRVCRLISGGLPVPPTGARATVPAVCTDRTVEFQVDQRLWDMKCPDCGGRIILRAYAS